MRTSIAAKSYFSFGLMAAIIVGSAAFILYNTTEARKNYERLCQNRRGAVLLADAQNALWQLRYGSPQFMVGDAAARAAIGGDESKWREQISDGLDAHAALDISQSEKRGLGALREIYKLAA